MRVSSTDHAEGGRKWGGLVENLAPLKDEAYQDSQETETSQSPEEQQQQSDVDESFFSANLEAEDASHSEWGGDEEAGALHKRRRGSTAEQRHSLIIGGQRLSHSVNEQGDEESALGSSSTQSNHQTQRRRANPPSPPALPKIPSNRSDVSGRRRFFADSKTTEIPTMADDSAWDEAAIDNMVEQVDPTKASTEPTSAREYAFAVFVGILMAFNMGFVNGACLSGFISGQRQGVAGYTNPYTESALQLANGNYNECKFQTVMIACFIGGSFVSGAVTPNAVPYRIEPTYGPSFLASALCLALATVLAATSNNHHDEIIFYLAGTASGIQNGISSSYTAKLIRSTGLTGTSTDIGLYLGQVVRGNHENSPKLVVLILIGVAFWLGGLLSFYATRHFTSLALLFTTVLFFIIGFSLMGFLVIKLKISWKAAVLGTWQWQVAAEKLRGVFAEAMDMSHLHTMSDRELEEIFDRIDIDKSGTIDAEELYILLRSTGVKITRMESNAMLRFADKDKDGVLSMDEWKSAIHTAMAPKSNAVMTSVRKIQGSTRKLVDSTRDLMGGGPRKSNGTDGSGSSHHKRKNTTSTALSTNRSDGSAASARGVSPPRNASASTRRPFSPNSSFASLNSSNSGLLSVEEESESDREQSDFFAVDTALEV